MTTEVLDLVNPVDWLNAVDNHPETWGVDLVVGASVALVGSTVVDGVADREVAVSIRELIRLGFLAEEFTGPCTRPTESADRCGPGCVESVLALRLPDR